jgi:hypothetical protein
LTFPVGFNSDSETVLGFIQHPPDRLLHMPVLLFLDRQGVVQAQWEGAEQPMGEPQQESNIRAKIQELLKAAATPKKGGKR